MVAASWGAHWSARPATPKDPRMKTHVTVPRGAYPAGIRETVEQKLAPLTRYFERIESLRAVLGKQKTSHRVELVVHVSDGAILVVDSKADSVEEALDDAQSRMKSLLSKHKKRLVQRHRQARRSPR